MYKVYIICNDRSLEQFAIWNPSVLARSSQSIQPHLQLVHLSTKSSLLPLSLFQVKLFSLLDLNQLIFTWLISWRYTLSFGRVIDFLSIWDENSSIFGRLLRYFRCLIFYRDPLLLTESCRISCSISWQAYLMNYSRLVRYFWMAYWSSYFVFMYLSIWSS
jgi:hypothetical protein